MENITLSGEDLGRSTVNNYRDLLNKIDASYVRDRELAIFSALAGKNYYQSNSKLLVYGRSVDGWRKNWQVGSSVEDKLKSIFVIPSDDKIAKCDMNWIIRNRDMFKTNKNKYNYKRSSFWCGARDVVKKLETNEKLSENSWPSYIAWSNVYKVSPKRGNPDRNLRAVQIPDCKLILREEINYFKPKHILFITGGWGKKILESINVMQDSKINSTVQFAGLVKFDYGHAKVVVAVRPEGKKRGIWVNDVVSAFNQAHGSA